MTGFTEGEGCFLINLQNSPRNKLKERVKLTFSLTQHLRDEALTRSLIKYFHCGNVYKNRETFEYRVTKFSDIENKIIPFYKKYPILGVKLKDFEDFCKAAELMKNKAHVTKDGLEKIRKIKAVMNTGREKKIILK